MGSVKDTIQSKLSIVLPVYNGEKYLEYTIESLLKSTYQNIELLLIDDGSTDQSPKICEKYAMLDSRVKVYHKHNEGVAATRNYGVLKATGEYLCFCDQDDIVEKDCYGKQIEQMVRDESDMCMCSVGRSIDGKISAFELSEDACYEGEEILEQLLYPLLFNGFIPPVKMGEKNRYPQIWSCMFRMGFWKEYNLRFRIYINFEDDFLVKTQALAYAERVSTIAHIGYYWRVNLGSETYAHRYIEDIAEKQQKCYEDLYQCVAGRINDDDVLKLFKSITYCKQYLDAIHNLTSPDKRKTRKEIRAYYDSNIYSRSFSDSIMASKYVKKGKIKPQIILRILAKKHTMISYYAEILLDRILLVTLHSQILTKIERRLKGIKG